MNKVKWSTGNMCFFTVGLCMELFDPCVIVLVNDFKP